MHLLKFSQSAVSRLMRLPDQVSFGLLVAGTTMLPASAASGTTVWTKASEIMQDVYTQIVSISTITAVVCASVALLLMNFSKNGRTVDDSRAWLKRIVIRPSRRRASFSRNNPISEKPGHLHQFG